MDQYRWLPLTKVRIPTTRHTLRRDALIHAVATAMTHKRLTLLSAPSGAGKTMLAAMALHDTPDSRGVWLSLDEEDNDPKTFLIALLTALQTVDPTMGQWVTQVLLPGITGTTDFIRWVGTLVNELEQDKTPLVLVLDDFHLLTDPIISAGLTYLLERMPPHLHLLATTRYEPALPLARLRAQGHIAEFHLAQLLFTADETAQLLNDELGLALSADDMAHVQQRSEGWIAGVRLLALSLGQMSPLQRSTFLAQLAAQDDYVFDLLAEEVMAQQPQEVRQFLLETSVLRDVTPALCRAVTQRENAAELLMQVYRRNLFLMAVEGADGTRSYRYHALFHDFLRHRLERDHPTLTRDLHLRAAAYSDPTQALYHYMHVLAWDQAAAVLTPIGRTALWQGRYGTLRDWLQSIPEPIRHTYPWLLYLEGMLLYHEGELPHAYDLLQIALSAFEASGNREGEWEVLGALIGNILLAFNPKGMDYLVSLTQRLLDSPIPPTLRVRTLMGKAWMLSYRLKWDEIGPILEEAMSLCRQQNDLQTYGAALPSMNKIFFFVPNGRERLTRFFRDFIKRFGEMTPFTGIARLVFADNALFIGAWQEAEAELTQAEAVLIQNGFLFYQELSLWISRHFLALAAGDTMKLAVAETQLFMLMKVPVAASLVYSVLSLISYTAWVYRDIQMLDRLRDEVNHLRDAGVSDTMNGQIGATVMEAITAMLENRLQEAETLLRPLVARQRLYRDSLLLPCDVRILLAHLYLRQRRREEAVALVEECFSFYETIDAPGLLLKHGDALPPLWELAETIPALRPFTARLRALWADLRDGRSLALPDSDERLTPREVEVLQLLATGVSNRDIAEQLVVSERTVKSHITHILGKMGVASRGQAVSRARALHLL